MTYRTVCTFLGLAISTLLPSAKADEWNKKTIVTLNSSVRVPGKVLAPGTYVLRLLDSPSDRNIVLVYNQNEDELIATIQAIPAYRVDISDQTILTFDDPESAVPMLKKWFYPGQNEGLEFVYTGESKEAKAPVYNSQSTAAGSSSVSEERTQLLLPPAIQESAAPEPSRIEVLNIAKEDRGPEASSGTDSADRAAGQEPAGPPSAENTGVSDSADTPGEPPAVLPETAQNVMLLPLTGAGLVALGLGINWSKRRTA
jgi:hypothetical protein